MPKRKSLSTATNGPAVTTVPIPPPGIGIDEAAPPPPKRRASGRRVSQLATGSTNPNKNANVLDGPQALRASPDADEKDERMDVENAGMNAEKQIKKEDPLEEGVPKTKAKQNAKKISKPAAEKEVLNTPKIKETNEPSASSEPKFLDPEADGGEEEAGEEELQAALSRPPPVHSDYLPLPWKGRLGYNRHPLKDPNAPPHATKNRPDRELPADIARGQQFVESLGKANAKDIVKMLRWNDKYGIKFMRLSSEMFPFASHEEYGYKLAPFVSEELAEAGRVAAELGHRLTTHPGQLGSPRKQVIDNAIRDLEYHAELLDLLKLPPQQDRDAVMILHLGGVFGDKEATLNRFRENYARLADNIKKRLVLENDDVSWCVHELLPLCEELNIPMVLDFHHHNIIFDANQIREGTKGIIDVFPRILATWKRKNITPKMHYSEPTPEAITGRQRRKHNPRVATLPPCPPDMDLMIEAKDKEQAVFELMRTFKLPGFDLINDINPHQRKDDNKPVTTPKKKQPKKSKKVKSEDDAADDISEIAEEPIQQVIPEEEVGMGGPDRRVYWPPGQEHWLRPVKRVVKKKEPNPEGETDKKLTPAQKKKAAAEAAEEGAKVEEEVYGNGVKNEDESIAATPTPASKKKQVPAAKGAKTNGAKAKPVKKVVKKEATPTLTEEDDEESELSDLEDSDLEEALKPKRARTQVNGVAKGGSQRQSGRAKKVSNYAEGSDEEV
ncbi:UV-damage endonuclease [Bacidia gigantensis]|uniref:UV-damage endonuclease n=1 Tax=Bacidia gigantensis TaxID=2732470 RepID=UPI001D04A579|nr:UV-damage endonuclease [Bacidia gigantensis]KAG8527715.1 UV-damage endonuclease [Bacidia gigantensis]